MIFKKLYFHVPVGALFFCSFHCVGVRLGSIRPRRSAPRIRCAWAASPVKAAGYHRGYDREAAAVAGVILAYKHRERASLLAADGRAEFGVKDVSAFWIAH